MIDSNDPDRRPPQPGTNEFLAGSIPPSGGLPWDGSDLYGDLFEPAMEPDPDDFDDAGHGPQGNRLRSTPENARASLTVGPTENFGTPVPTSPPTLAASGLTLMQICDLILKQLYLQGNMLGIDIARQARLPFQVIDEGLRFLKDEKCIEVASGELIGSASYRFLLTDIGRHRAREAFAQCRYVGPAPVTLKAYAEQCRRQAVTGTVCRLEALRDAFSGLIVRRRLLEELGPAVCSGRSIFIYGPPGNGKTMIAKGLGTYLNANGGDIYVPYAIHTENSIITVFDPTIHQPTDHVDPGSRCFADMGTEATPDSAGEERQPSQDLRWRRVRRPVVVTGGELTLEMLDLRYNTTSNFYTAPLQIKANGGVFLIDDFGRQIVSPRDLLNRWILPLEERIDYLSLATGKKFAVPFEGLIIFSTNLDPRELVDEAFLRRIRHKIKIGPPSRELFTEIFQQVCRDRDIAFDPTAVDYLFSNFYDRGKPPRSSDPRDLLEIVHAVCRFRGEQVLLTSELMAEATERFFCHL